MLLPGPKDRADISKTPGMIQMIGEPLPFRLTDLQLPASMNHLAKDFLYFTALNLNAGKFDLKILQDILKSFSLTDDVWSHKFLDCVITAHQQPVTQYPLIQHSYIALHR